MNSITCNGKRRRCTGEPVKEFLWRVDEFRFHADKHEIVEAIKRWNPYNEDWATFRWDFIKEVYTYCENLTKEELAKMFAERTSFATFKEIKDGYIWFTCKSKKHVVAYNDEETPILTNNQENFMGVQQGVGELLGCTLHHTLSDEIYRILKNAILDKLNEKYDYRHVDEFSPLMERHKPMLQKDFVEHLTAKDLKHTFEVHLVNGDVEHFGMLNGEYKHKYVYKGCGIGSFFKFYKRFGNLKNSLPQKYVDIDFVVVNHMTIRPEELWHLS